MPINQPNSEKLSIKNMTSLRIISIFMFSITHIKKEVISRLIEELVDINSIKINETN